MKNKRVSETNASGIVQLAASLKRANRLPFKIKIAWAAAVSERVIGLYSPYFQEKYLQIRFFNLVQEFLESGLGVVEECGRLCNALLELTDAAEDEGYSRNIFEISLNLLSAMSDQKDTNAVQAAIEYAGYAFALCQLYENDLPGVVASESPSDIDDLQVPFYVFARDMLDVAIDIYNRGGVIDEKSFENVNLTMDKERINSILEKILLKNKSWPNAPIHEHLSK